MISQLLAIAQVNNDHSVCRGTREFAVKAGREASLP